LLTVQHHNYTDALGKNPSRPAVPYYVRRSEEYIEAHAHEVISIDDLVEISGVSARSLYEGFRNFRQTTPMRFIKSIRLDLIRRELLAADPAHCSVTAVATKFGLCHLSNFAGDYRKRFGETPSETLRRAR
jgi:AraC-like DNA-binding protein